MSLQAQSTLGRCIMLMLGTVVTWGPATPFVDGLACTIMLCALGCARKEESVQTHGHIRSLAAAWAWNYERLAMVLRLVKMSSGPSQNL